jgi:RNA polymerase primary sigma factor
MYLPMKVLPIEDLVQEGMLGLLDAVERYDIDKPSASFHTLAWFLVRRQCSRAVRLNRRAVQVKTMRKTGLPARVRNAERELSLLHGSASRQDIAEHLGVDVADVENVLFRYGTDLSLDAPLWLEGDGGDEVTLHGTMVCASEAPAADELCARKEIHTLVEAQFELQDRELLLADDSFVEIGKRRGVSRQRVDQLEKRLRSRFIESVRAAS